MKKPIIKLFDKLILLLLGMSGIIYSCAKYGEPVAEYEVYGTVTDKEKNPIENIRVSVKYLRDTLYTNPDGKFDFKSWELSRNVRLKVEDIDGEAHGGEFLPREIEVVLDLVKKGKRDKPDKYAKKITVELEKNEVIPAYGVPIAPFKP